MDVTGADRLMVRHKVSLIMPLPRSYKDRIAAVPGVEKVTHLNWFGGIYQDPKNHSARWRWSRRRSSSSTPIPVAGGAEEGLARGPDRRRSSAV